MRTTPNQHTALHPEFSECLGLSGSFGGALTWVAYGAMVKVARRMLDEGRFAYVDTPGMQGIATLLDG